MARKLILLLLAAGMLASVLLWERYSLARQGERDFAALGCVSCHFSGGGPNLTHVVRKHDDKLLSQFIGDPGSVYRARNMQSLNEGFGHMPQLQTTPQNVRAIIAYLHELDRTDKQ